MSEPTMWALAKAEIQRLGWYQGDFAPSEDDGEPVCIVGACALGNGGLSPWDSYEDDEWLGRLVNELETRGFRASTSTPYGFVGEWNDNPDRTVDEVYALLDELDTADRETSR